jgi:hypothetical protein
MLNKVENKSIRNANKSVYRIVNNLFFVLRKVHVQYDCKFAVSIHIFASAKLDNNHHGKNKYTLGRRRD